MNELLFKGVFASMRKLFCLLLVLVLLPFTFAGAEETAETDQAAEATPAAEESVETTPEPTAEPTPQVTLTPEEWANAKVPYKRMPEPIKIIPYDELPPVVEGQHHYLLLCIDQWNRDPRPAGSKPPTGLGGRRRDMYGNTDGIVLVTLDTRAHRIMLTSFIRDAIIQKSTSTETDEKFGRINYVYNDYGPEELCKIISEHIGVRIEKYILFTFKQIANIVDYLGGVDIELTDAEINALQYTVLRGTVTGPDGKDLQDPGTHPAGVYSFKTTEWAKAQNAKTDAKVIKRTGGCSAVLYMRIRKFGGGGDFMRTQRARTVLSLLADKCRTMTWDDAKALANNILENNNMTNMNLDDMLQAAEQAYSLRECTMEELRIPVDGAVRAINHANMMAQEVNWPVCRDAMYDYLQNSWLVMDEDDED